MTAGITFGMRPMIADSGSGHLCVNNWPPVILERPELPLAFFSDNFKIHYTVEGDYAVYHPDEDVNPADGTPDYINRMAEYLEQSWGKYIIELNYDRPPPDNGMGGDDLYDVYVEEITGQTVPESPSEYYAGRSAYSSYMYIGHDLRNLNHPDDPIPLLKVTCAHELFHAVQMSYRAFTSDATDWWYELTAGWAEERVFDEINEVYYYLEDYYSKIFKSIYDTGGTHMYGAWVWAEYLTAQHGNDTIRQAFIKLINFDNSLTAVKLVLEDAGYDFGDEFSNFAAWNYFTADNYRPDFFPEGHDFPASVPVSANHYEYPTGWIETPKAVENLGIAYIYFDSVAAAKSELYIEFIADDTYPENVTIAAIFHESPVQVFTYNLAPSQDTLINIEDFDRCEAVVMAVSWPYQGYEISDSAMYRYNAYVDTTLTDIIEIEPVISENLEFYGNYPNPFNLTTNITFSWKNVATDYTISIHDLNGRLIDRLDGIARPGVNTVRWTPNSSMSSGMYFGNLKIGGLESNRKFVLLK